MRPVGDIDPAMRRRLVTAINGKLQVFGKGRRGETGKGGKPQGWQEGAMHEGSPDGNAAHLSRVV